MILRNILKERGHKTTYRDKRELVTVAFALYQQQLPIVVANVDDLEHLDYQTLLTNESNGEYFKCLTNVGQLLRRRLVLRKVPMASVLQGRAFMWALQL